LLVFPANREREGTLTEREKERARLQREIKKEREGTLTERERKKERARLQRETY